MTEFEMASLEMPAESTTEQVFNALYDAIVSLKLEPGSKISETDISNKLNVSRQPVRDAFFRLSNLGLLSIRPQRATLITLISEHALSDAVFVRTASEVECLKTIMRRNCADDISILREKLKQQKELLKLTDPGAFHSEDERFHAEICRLAGHAHVWNLIREKKAHMDRVRYLTLSHERRQFVVDEHTEIVDAMERGDAKNAEAHLRSHLSGVIDIAPLIRERNGQYFEPLT